MKVLERVRRLRRSRTHRHAIDLGGGRHIDPEDVLESHFRRLALTPSTPHSHEVSVQIAPNLHTAIRVVAPALAPLTQIAEELVTRIPTVQPAPSFRSELHRALEQAHREQAEWRAAHPAAQHTLWPWILAGALTAVAFTAILLWLRRRKPIHE